MYLLDFFYLLLSILLPIHGVRIASCSVDSQSGGLTPVLCIVLGINQLLLNGAACMLVAGS